MAMSIWITIASAIAALNVALLAVLGLIWLRNYRRFKTPLVLGLLAFAGIMLAENLAAIYFFFSMGMLYASDPFAQQFIAVLRGLQLAALTFLTYVTWQ